MANMTVSIGATQLDLVEGDIAAQDTDAIVTAAHWDLGGGQGTDGSVHFRAGPQLLEACARIGGCPTGDAVITEGFNLPARYVIHAVGPVYEEGSEQEAEFLAGAYHNSLRVAVSHGLHSVSFPSISTGAFCFPCRSRLRLHCGRSSHSCRKRRTNSIWCGWCCIRVNSRKRSEYMGKRYGR